MQENKLNIPAFHTAFEIELKKAIFDETGIDLTEDGLFEEKENKNDSKKD